MLATDIFDDYVSWLQANVPLAYENLAPPADPAELDALEGAIGYSVPADLRAVLGKHNGQRSFAVASGATHGVPCIPTLNFLSIAEIRKRWDLWTDIRSGPDIEELQQMGGVFPEAEGLIKPVYTSPGWIALWSDPVNEDYVGLDLDPGPNGTAGQIINFGRDEEEHFICAKDFTSLLQILLEEVRSGSWQATKIRHDANGDAELSPWFGDPAEHFFNALYERFNPGGN